MSQTTPAPEASEAAPTGSRALRVPYSRDGIPVVLLGPDGKCDETMVTGRNISKGGIGVLIELSVQRGTRCEVEMQTLTGKRSRHEAMVIHSRQVRNELHEIGIAFDDVIDLEKYVTLQRVQRMIYEKEKKADAEKLERVLAHAAAAEQARSGKAASPLHAPAARPIVSQLASQPAKLDQLQAYLAELGDRTARLTAAVEQADRTTMLELTQWVIDTAQPNGYPTLFAFANAVVTYLEDQDEDLTFACGQVKELISYLRRAQAAT